MVTRNFIRPFSDYGLGRDFLHCILCKYAGNESSFGGHVIA